MRGRSRVSFSFWLQSAVSDADARWPTLTTVELLPVRGIINPSFLSLSLSLWTVFTRTTRLQSLVHFVRWSLGDWALLKEAFSSFTNWTQRLHCGSKNSPDRGLISSPWPWPQMTLKVISSWMTHRPLTPYQVSLRSDDVDFLAKFDVAWLEN